MYVGLVRTIHTFFLALKPLKHLPYQYCLFSFQSKIENYILINMKLRAVNYTALSFF